MRSLVRALLRLKLKRRNRTAQEAKACHPSHMQVYPCDKFASKPQQYSPEKGWRLLNHIGYTGTTAKIDQAHDFELDEDILERIDFLACLFGSTRIEQ